MTTPFDDKKMLQIRELRVVRASHLDDDCTSCARFYSSKIEYFPVYIGLFFCFVYGVITVKYTENRWAYRLCR